MIGPNPSGLCRCGCGQTTKLARWSDAKRGVTAGQPINYVRGHQSRGERKPHGPYAKTRAKTPPNPNGICFCGCGGITPLARSTSKRDNTLLGFHVCYIPHHFHRKNRPEYTEEDRGYATRCWIWQLHRDHAGYGKVTRNGRSQPAHRWYYSHAKGVIPDGFHIDHLCFNPACVNPEHLQAVPPLVNNARRRFIRLSDDKATVIRQLHEWGASYRAIGNLFGVRPETIYSVCSGKNWEPSRKRRLPVI